ncbi:ABC transporter permease [Niameybacter massiliensis]|uniref:ABC transporter permease n=1 Tax=Holtiella tumoricola TaxID=3018743 RepID=A0AA42J122_9FIRM|nr:MULTISPECIES: ABC transporter permease [Lachnospirales]MDA3732017.1 ABC transporter permease [Holtiella tumoricola]
MSLYTLTSCLELGLLYGLLALGIYISYRILNIADLTVDGSFTLGAAVSVMAATLGHPFIGIILGVLAGALAGVVTAFLQTKLKVQPILAGILTMTALYTININVMGGKPNLALANVETLFSKVNGILGKQWGGTIVGLIIAVLVVLFIVVFLHTQVGLSIRATGDNEDMVRSSSINVDFTKTIGLAMANALVGLSGALIGQNQGFADSNMGVGMVVAGLASLVIGEIIFGTLFELIFKKRTILMHVIAVLLGSVAYRTIIAVALEFNLSASSMKLISAIIITLAISYPVIKDKFNFNKKRRMHQVARKEEANVNTQSYQ